MRRVVAVASLLALAGCGSTVQLSGTTAGSGGSGLDSTNLLGTVPTSAPIASAAPTGAVSPRLGAPGTASSVGGDSSAGSSDASSTGGPSAARASSDAITLKGITPTTISVGINWADTAATNAAVSGTGANGSKAGDMLAEQRAVAAWINSHGGIAGRKIVLVEHQQNINDDSATAAQKMCADWTQDHHVVAGLGAVAAIGAATGIECLTKAKTLSIGASYDVGSKRSFDAYRPFYYSPASVEMTAVGDAYATGLSRQGFFPKGAKIGLLVYDAPEFRDGVANGLVPALKRSGLSLKDLTWITPPSALSDEGRLVADIQSAVLKYRSDGVTHVLFMDGNSSITYFFIQQAKSQSYRPAYGFSTLSYTSFVQSNFKASDLHGSLGVGWMPSMDVDIAHLPSNPARTLCQSIMKQAGQSAVAETDLTLQLTFCSQFFFLKAALEKAPQLTPEGFQAGVAALGRTSYTAALGFNDTYSPTKHWGSSEYRAIKYVDACSCFQYYGPANPI